MENRTEYTEHMTQRFPNSRHFPVKYGYSFKTTKDLYHSSRKSNRNSQKCFKNYNTMGIHSTPIFCSIWLEMFSRSHSVVNELMFMSVLPAVSISLLGSKSYLRPSEANPYKENLCFFSLCISPPNAGKSQAFKHGCKIPIQYVEKANQTCILLDKFTDAGMRQHLLSNNGLAAIIKDECYDTLKQIITEKQMGTLCRSGMANLILFVMFIL